MEFNALRQLQAIVEHGSISKAARHLNTSQPRLTQAIQRLESSLKTTLLFRDNRGVRLTDSGRVLLEASVQVMEILDRASESIRALQEDEVGQFTLGCHESLGAYFLPELMRDLLERAPSIELGLKNGPSAWVQETVLDRGVDFGLVVNPEPHPDLVMVELFRDEVAVFIAAGDELPDSLREAQERVRAGPLIYAGRIGQCKDLIARFVSGGYMPDRRLECGDLQLVKSLAAAELGVALLPRRVAEHGARGRFLLLHAELPYYPDTIYLIYRADIHRTRATLRLKDALVAHGKALSTSDPSRDTSVRGPA